jgi:hypothetical protein
MVMRSRLFVGIRYENSQLPSDERPKALLLQNELHQSNVRCWYYILDGALDNIEEYGPIVCRAPTAIVSLTRPGRIWSKLQSVSTLIRTSGHTVHRRPLEGVKVRCAQSAQP